MMIDVYGHVREVHSSMSTLFCYHLEHDVACYEAPAFGVVGDSGICEASVVRGTGSADPQCFYAIESMYLSL